MHSTRTQPDLQPLDVASPPVPLRLGHVHLRVRDAERSATFYAHHVGLKVVERLDGRFVFLSNDAVHHVLALQGMGDRAAAPEPQAVGLYHTAWEVADAAELARAWDGLDAAEVPFAAVDHGISWALYFSDPDGNGLEVYLDRRDRPGGRLEWRGTTSRLSRNQIARDLFRPHAIVS